MTSDKRAERWSLRKLFLFGFAFIAIVFTALIFNALYKNEQQRLQTFQRIAAMEVVRARYRPTPELLEIGFSPKNPCETWKVTDLQTDGKEKADAGWKVTCEIAPKLNPGKRTVVAQWTVDPFLADTPDVGAQKLFIRNPQ